MNSKGFLKIYGSLKKTLIALKQELVCSLTQTKVIKTMDDHIYDAVLLECKRIGYGYELTKFPLLMNLIKEKGLAIEISPISNPGIRLFYQT